MKELNELAQQVWAALVASHPDWEGFATRWSDGDIEVAVPAPAGSNAGHLVVFTDRGERIWVRFSPPAMSYRVERLEDLEAVVEELLSERAVFVTTWRGERWTGTTLLRPAQAPVLEAGETARAVSWTGAQDGALPAEAFARR